jgi:F0F1-type ATP synthase membrane subunit c/vacuolar-type H+-ATPase subunit K
MQLRCRAVGVVLASLMVLSSTAMAAERDAEHADPSVKDGSLSMTEVYISVGLAASAALTISVSILGAGYAVGRIGSAALGAAAEHPELLTRSLLFVALAEGLAVLGFAVAMLIVMRIP